MRVATAALAAALCVSLVAVPLNTAFTQGTKVDASQAKRLVGVWAGVGRQSKITVERVEADGTVIGTWQDLSGTFPLGKEWERGRKAQGSYDGTTFKLTTPLGNLIQWTFANDRELSGSRRIVTGPGTGSTEPSKFLKQ